jgi:hypothetical protein
MQVTKERCMLHTSQRAARHSRLSKANQHSPPAALREHLNLLFETPPEGSCGEHGNERALQRLRRVDEADDKKGIGDRLSRQVTRMSTQRLRRTFKLKRPLRRLLEARWGSGFLEVPAMIERLETTQAVRLIDRSIYDWLKENAAPRSGLDVESWQRAQATGVVVDTYITDLLSFAAALERKQLGSGTELAARVHRLISKESLDHFSTLAGGERSILLAGTHAGVYGLSQHLIHTCLPNSVRLGAHNRGGITNVRIDPTRALMEMVRHLRTPGAVATIRADGNFKGNAHPVEVMGKTLYLGHGAPHAAHFARADTAFYLTSWRNDRIFLDVQPGPSLEKGERIDAWTERWLQAFAIHIESIIVGNPRNVRGVGGFWSALSNKRGSSEGDFGDEEAEDSEY